MVGFVPVAQIASPGVVHVPGVMCARCGRTFSVRVEYAIRTGAMTPAHSGTVDVPLQVDILNVEEHECAPSVGEQLEFDLWPDKA